MHNSMLHLYKHMDVSSTHRYYIGIYWPINVCLSASVYIHAVTWVTDAPIQNNFGKSPLEADWRRSGAFRKYLAGDHLSQIWATVWWNKLLRNPVKKRGKTSSTSRKAFSGSSIMKYILSSSDKTDATVASTLTTLAAMIVLFKWTVASLAGRHT